MGDVNHCTADMSRQTPLLIQCFSLQQLQLYAVIETETIYQTYC